MLSRAALADAVREAEAADRVLVWLDRVLWDDDTDGALAAGAAWHDLAYDLPKQRRAAAVTLAGRRLA